MGNLKDCIASLQSGSREKGGAIADGIPSLGAEHLNSFGGFNLSENKIKYISKEHLSSMKTGKIQKHDVLIVKDGATTGKVSYVDASFPFTEAAINEHVFLLRTKENLLPKYLFHYLFSDIGQRNILNDFRGATVGGISRNFVDMTIPLPPISIQQKIADVLDRASALIEKRKTQIEKLDLLVKSQFVEMFGEKQYPIVRLEDICDFITKGTTPSTQKIVTSPSEKSIPYIKVYNLSDNGKMLFYENPQYVDVDTHNKALARSKVFPNDVLMNIVGLPLGKFALVPNDFAEWNINQAVAIFRSLGKVVPIYLMHAMMQPNVLRPFLEQAVGIRQINLSLKQCRELEIQLPPLVLQNQFSAFVQHIETQKSLLQQSLAKLELNYKSLMQKCFRGEMF